MKATIDWNKTLRLSKTTGSVQVIPNARARRGRPLYDVTYTAIRELGARFTRYLPWGAYPRLQIAALYPPTPTETSWDFTFIDPELIDFLEATKGRDPIVNFSAVPAWMFKMEAPASYPDDPDEMAWHVDNAGPPALVDPTGQQLAEYYARIVSWYVKGGFTDENGAYHHSGHAFELPWWGTLNEMDGLGPEQYTTVYDAIVTEVRKVSPNTRFVGMELSGGPLPKRMPAEFIEYFLDPKNHKPGIAVDMIAYHFYAFGLGDEATSIETWQYTFFDQADGFLAQARYIECLRKRLSPEALTYATEIGSVVPSDFDMGPDKAEPRFPPEYWNLSAALYAYTYMEFARLGLDVAGQAGFSFYPGNFAGVSMVDWNAGQLNARYHVLKLVNDHFGPGDRLVPTITIKYSDGYSDAAAQAFDCADGRKVLVVNKRNRIVQVELDVDGPLTLIGVVDAQTDQGTLPLTIHGDGKVSLQPFAIAVLTVGTVGFSDL